MDDVIHLDGHGNEVRNRDIVPIGGTYAGESGLYVFTRPPLMVATCNFRWAVINAAHPPQLQQAWRDHYGSGDVEWRAVPMVLVENMK